MQTLGGVASAKAEGADNQDIKGRPLQHGMQGLLRVRLAPRACSAWHLLQLHRLPLLLHQEEAQQTRTLVIAAEAAPSVVSLDAGCRDERK